MKKKTAILINKLIVILSFLIISSAGLIFAEADKKLNIAVADFNAKNVSEMEAVAVSDFFRIELVNIGVFNVLERKNMEMVLAEQKFQVSGCTDQECAVKMGKLLNSNKIITGSLYKIDTIFYISAQVIDIESGKIQYSEKIQCENAKYLPDKSEELARAIADSIVKKKLKYTRYTEEDKRKKYAIYAMGVSPMISLENNDLNYKDSIGNQTYTYRVTLKSMDFPSAGGGGVKIFPWENIFVDLSGINNLNGEIPFQVKLSNLTSNSVNGIFRIQQSNTYWGSINYLLKPEKTNFSTSFGLGLYTTRISIDNFSGIDVTNNDSGNTSYSLSYPPNTYININNLFLTVCTEWKPVDNFSLNLGMDYILQDLPKILFPLYYTITTTQPFAAASKSNSTELELVDLRKAIVLRLAVSYYFNIKL
ncbi:MAG: CsgG/HfaB family protein [Elusimicrobia bacterium]|nr:CsgG/HfaB family protein [Candidatus Liberimonas magnetica]